MLLRAQLKFEFRGVWIATIENMDWPSRAGLSTEKQKTEYVKLLDFHQRTGINAVIVQVRPAADAFYENAKEPWSEFITGKQGRAPEPYYDPLAFMIEEAHKRGMEFHAWINPYRAVFDVNKSSVDTGHITNRHPEWFVTYGKVKYFNPGLPEVRKYVVDIITDIVGRYDIDALHMDDYFYPYPIDGKDFQDGRAFQLYGNGMKKDDWRRSNCDSIVKNIYEAICLTNIRVKFGISPFGVWRNKREDPDGSDTKAGTTCYSTLYADVLLWLKNGWVDYVAPQLYWEIGHKLAGYKELAEWWSSHTYGKHLYIGHGLYRVGSNAAWKDKNELPREIDLARSLPGVQGSAFFSCRDLVKNGNGWADTLRENYYALPAMVPPMDWIDSAQAEVPEVVKVTEDSFTVTKGGEERIRGFSLFSVPKDVDASPEYSTFIRMYPATESIGILRSECPVPTGFRLFIAALSINNMLSDWVELK